MLFILPDLYGLPLQLHNKIFLILFNEELMLKGNKRILFQVCYIKKIIDMLSSDHNLSLYKKLMTVLNNEDWQSMIEIKNMSHHHLSLYTKLITVLNK